MALSRRTFNEQKRYETVIYKENTTPADFEMVEFQDIIRTEREALAKALITDGFLGDGFRVVGLGLANAVEVLSGTGFSFGKRTILPDSNHGLISGQHIFNMGIATPVTARVDLVYIDIFADTVNSTMDPDIEDPLLGPTADRERMRYVFRISEGSATVPTLPVGHVGMRMALVTRRAGDPLVNAADIEDVRPLASLNQQFKPKNLIVVSPSGGDFNDPMDALNSITTASASNPFTILVMPGVYTVSAALVFDQPYVSMIGTDPDACSILVNTAGISAADVSADHIVIKNLKIGFALGSGSHSATIRTTGAFNLVLENLVVSEDFYNENATNSFRGLDFASGGAVSVRRCRVFAQNTTTSAAVIVGPTATVTIDDTEVTAAVSDAMNHSNGGVLVVRRSRFLSTRVILTSAGTLTARDSTWRLQVLKAFGTMVGSTVVLTSSVTFEATDCVIDGATQRADMTDTTALWTNVVMNCQFYTSGGGTSRYRNCEFHGLDINGTVSDLDHCLLTGTSAWAIAGTSQEALVLRGGTGSRVTGCRTSPGVTNAILVLASSPFIKDCHLTQASDGSRAIHVNLASNPVIDNCLFQPLVPYTFGFGLIHITDTVSVVTLVHSHLEGNSGGHPTYFVNAGSVGSKLKKGRNTGTSGALYNAATVTVVTSVELN